MAKQQKQSIVTGTKKTSAPEFSAGGYILRNLVVIVGIAFILFLIDKQHSKEREFKKIVTEFQQLKQSNLNVPRQQELYNKAMELQNELAADTGFFAKITRGYNWAIHDLALGNLKDISEKKEELHRQGVDSTEQSLLEAKMAMRVGNYSFIQYIKKNTPEDAVLLLPEGDAEVSNNSRWNFIYDPEWMEYFIYPRLCVAIGRENEHPDLAKRVTHIVIIEGKGYDKLKYVVPAEQRPTEAVFPIDAPPAQFKAN